MSRRKDDFGWGMEIASGQRRAYTPLEQAKVDAYRFGWAFITALGIHAHVRREQEGARMPQEVGMAYDAELGHWIVKTKIMPPIPAPIQNQYFRMMQAEA